MPSQLDGGRHQAKGDLFDPPLTDLARFREALTEPRPRGPVGQHAAHGQVPVQRVGSPKHESREPARRTRVTLTPPVVREDDEVRIHRIDPPSDGLGTFDLGSVPASVTPPRSWRKAAWFATASSGGVVVALLCAGSFLVTQPDDEQAISGWTDRRGGQPTLDGERLSSTAPVVPAPTTTGDKPAGPGQGSSTAPGKPTSLPATSATGGGQDRGTSLPDSATRAPGDTGGTGTSVPSTTQRPKKPPAKPAEKVYDDRRFFAMAADPQKLGNQTESFFNTVTENPSRAHAMTTGKLNAQGPSGLARYYADVAYFEVQRVEVHQYEGDGVTVSTLKVVHDDGSVTTEERTLTFGENGKIEDDGR